MNGTYEEKVGDTFQKGGGWNLDILCWIDIFLK